MFQIWAVKRAIRDARGLSSDEKWLLELLLSFRDGSSGEISPSYAQLADASDWGRATVIRRIARLRAAGVVRVEGGGGRSRSSRFSIDIASLQRMKKPAHVDDSVSNEKPAHVGEPVSSTETGSLETDTGSNDPVNRLTQVSHSEDLSLKDLSEGETMPTKFDPAKLGREPYASRIRETYQEAWRALGYTVVLPVGGFETRELAAACAMAPESTPGMSDLLAWFTNQVKAFHVATHGSPKHTTKPLAFRQWLADRGPVRARPECIAAPLERPKPITAEERAAIDRAIAECERALGIPAPATPAALASPERRPA